MTGVILLLMLFAVPSLQAQAPQVTSAELSLQLSEVNALWFRSLDSLKNGDFEAGLRDLEDLNFKKLQLGLHNLSDYSHVLIREALKIREQGSSAYAKRLLEAAQKLSPDLPAVYFAAIAWHVKERDFDVYAITKALWKGCVLKLTSPSILISYVSKGLLLLLITGVFTSMSFIVFSFIYYYRAVFFYVKEKLPVEIPLLAVQVVGWILIAAVTLGLGIAWGLLLLGFFLIWHLDLSAKWILQSIFVFAAMLALLLIVLGITYSTHDAEYFHALSQLGDGEFSPRSIAVLQQQLRDHPEDSYAIFALGFIAQQNGLLEEALEAYSMLPRDFADWPRAQNNLANIYQHYYRQSGERSWYQKAEDAYDNAIRNTPKFFEGHYNYAQLYLLDNQSENAGDEIKKARALDYERYTLYSQYVKDGIMTIDAPLSTIGLIKRLSYQDFSKKGLVLAGAMWAGWSRFPDPWIFSIASAVLLLVSFMFGVRKKGQKARVQYCHMCGDPYLLKQPRKKKGQEETRKRDLFCLQCRYIFKKKTVVKPEKRAAKVKQIQLRQKMRALIVKLLSLCVPGSGQIYSGYPLKGTLIAGLFSLGAAYYLLRMVLHFGLEYPGSRGEHSWIALIFFGVLLVGTYLFNVYDISKLSPKNQ
ncbi:hypothetical protein CSB45_14375 [candidate division KSB3 bacterium]|uniref:Tetratricopeptide repeat protein n=1 Tax=candidate division KSB3 bacterium TaxID=2044937 RepID=A0A2G6E146_9BACT|nr:MAG: hypothetical protein CSB45_14375 [candidate division KSB3 bacterium]